MAYNFWVESAAKIDWEQLNKSVQPFQLLEYVPMPGMGLNGGDAIGLSINMRNAGPCAYEEFLQVAALLQTEFQCTIYTMYNGTVVDDRSLEQIKADII